MKELIGRKYNNDPTDFSKQTGDNNAVFAQVAGLVPGTFRNCDFTTTEINFLVMDRNFWFERGLSLCLTKFRSREKFRLKNHREHGKPKSPIENS